MKKFLILAASIAVGSISQFATAHDDEPSNPVKEVPMTITIDKVKASVPTTPATPDKDTPKAAFTSKFLVTEKAVPATAKKDAAATITISSPGTLTLTIVEKDGAFRVSAGSLTFGGDKSAPAEVKVRTVKVGKVIKVGPDNKVVEFTITDNDVPKEVLGGLPSDVRSRILLPKAELGIEVKGALEAAKRAMDAQALVAEKERLQMAKARAVLETERDRQLVRAKAMEAQALAAQREAQALKAEVKARIDAEVRARRQQQGSHTTDPGEISAKLDKILDRLDRLEKEVDTVKAKRDK
jgi:hypothetical protein